MLIRTGRQIKKDIESKKWLDLEEYEANKEWVRLEKLIHTVGDHMRCSGEEKCLIGPYRECTSSVLNQLGVTDEMMQKYV